MVVIMIFKYKVNCTSSIFDNLWNSQLYPSESNQIALLIVRDPMVYVAY